MVADKSYGLDADGNVVLQSDPRCATILASEGGFIPDHIAKQYDLPKEFGAKSKATADVDAKADAEAADDEDKPRKKK